MLRVWPRSLNRTLLSPHQNNPKILELQKTFKIWENFVTKEEEQIILREVDETLRFDSYDNFIIFNYLTSWGRETL